MEALNERIKTFIGKPPEKDINYQEIVGYGNHSGNGCGYGVSTGAGTPYGAGSGAGDSSGRGYIGCSGNGAGNGGGLIEFNGDKVYYIDGIPTVIKRLHANLAKGYVIGKDFTTVPCYIAKDNIGHFAHGESGAKARENLANKALMDKTVDERVRKFIEHFDLDKTYSGHEFYKWHNILTGSCDVGRELFVKNNEIDLDREYTVFEFLNITEMYYEGWIISKVRKAISERSSK